VAGERRTRILSRLVGLGTPDFDMQWLCQVSAEVTCMSAAGIMLMSGDGSGGSSWASDSQCTFIEHLQLTLGQGPCIDAYQQDRPVLEPDLAEPSSPRWLGFTGPAVAAGVQAVFGFPLHMGAVRLGALALSSDWPGRLSGEQHADALVLAQIAAQTVLMLQARASPGELAAELAEGAAFHPMVHQASGMIAAQLAVGVGVALVRLRAYAFGHDRDLTEVANDVVTRELRFDA